MGRVRALVPLLLVGLSACRRAEPPQAVKPSPQSDVVEKTRRATVFVTVNISGARMSGTGFLVGVHKGAGLVVTNRHVVTDDYGQTGDVYVVFASGTSSARTVKAEVIAKDVENDLALLRVTKGPFPDPIDPGAGSRLVETLPVYLFGFPFGKALTAAKTPEITIGKGTISSLRRDDAGEVFAIQVDGDLNPGNSGGPLVGLDGGLVGVAVAKISASNIAFAIPAARAADLLRGRPSSLELNETEVHPGSAKWRIAASLIDPLEKVTRVEIIATPVSSLPGEPKSRPGAGYGAVSAEAQRQPLDRTGFGAASDLVLSGPAVDTDYYVQLEISREGEPTLFTEPRLVTAHLSGEPSRVLRPGTLRTELASDGRVLKKAAARKVVDIDVADARDVVVSLPCAVDDVVAGGGRFLVLKLGAVSALGVYDMDRKRLERMIPLPSPRFLVAAGGGIALVAYGDNQLLATFDLATGAQLARKASPFPGEVLRLVMGHSSSREALLVAWSRKEKDALTVGYLLDVMTLQPVLLPESKARGPMPPQRLSFSNRMTLDADGTFQTLAVWSDGTVTVMTRSDDNLTSFERDRSPGPIRCGDDGRLYAPDCVLGRDLALLFRVEGMLYPGIGGAFFLALLPDGTLDLYRAGSSEKLVSAGTVPGWPQPSRSQPALDLGRLLVFDAGGTRIVFVRRDREALIQRDISLTSLLEGSGADYLVVLSSPPSNIRRGMTLSYQIQAFSKSPGISYTLDFGPPGMHVSPSGLVTWDVPQVAGPDLSREVTAVLTLRSSSGQQVFHNLRISIE